MIDVYFMPKGNGNCVGAISLKEFDPVIKMDIWAPYTITPITDKTILFRNDNNEFTITTNKPFRHKTGQIDVKFLKNGLLNVTVREL